MPHTLLARYFPMVVTQRPHALGGLTIRRKQSPWLSHSLEGSLQEKLISSTGIYCKWKTNFVFQTVNSVVGVNANYCTDWSPWDETKMNQTERAQRYFVFWKTQDTRCGTFRGANNSLALLSLREVITAVPWLNACFTKSWNVKELIFNTIF